MSTNPDNKFIEGLSNSGEIYLAPTQGALRFIEKEVDNHGTPAKARVLQQYQWCMDEGDFGWYDIPLVEV